MNQLVKNYAEVALFLSCIALTAAQFLPFGSSAYYPMEITVNGNEVSGSSVLEGENENLEAIFGNGVSMSGTQSGLRAKLSNIPGMNDCFTLADNCPDGYTISFFVNVGPKQDFASYVFYIQAGDNIGGSGLNIMYLFSSTKLRVRMTSSTQRWEIVKIEPFVRGLWIWYVVTWHPSSGLHLYKDGTLHGSDTTPVAAHGGLTVLKYMYIGRNKGAMDTYRLEAIYDEMIIWNSAKNLSFLQSVHQTITTSWGHAHAGPYMNDLFKIVEGKKLPEGPLMMKTGLSQLECITACLQYSSCFSVSWGTASTLERSICRLSNIVNPYHGTVNDTNHNTYFKL